MDILLGGYEPKTYWGAGGGMCPQCYHPPPPPPPVPTVTPMLFACSLPSELKRVVGIVVGSGYRLERSSVHGSFL